MAEHLDVLNAAIVSVRRSTPCDGEQIDSNQFSGISVDLRFQVLFALCVSVAKKPGFPPARE